MGVISIPPNPAGPGVCRVHLELDKDEARATIDRLKLILQRLPAHAAERAQQKLASLQISSAPTPGPGEA